jgi:CheY-like chemotaxis protein
MSFPFSRMASDGEAHPAMIRTLVLDDSAFDRTRIRRLGARLDLPMEFVEADSVRGLSPLLDRHSYDLILVDYEMPEADGLQALDLIRNHAGQGSAATIMISGQAGTRVAVSALKRGCQDFIPKADISREVLRPAILQALASKRQALHAAIPHDPGALHGDVSAMIRGAFDAADMQDVLRRPMEEGLMRAAEAVGLHWGKAHYDEVARFIENFQQEDEFLFLRN